MDWNVVIMEPIRAMLTRFGGFVPKLVGAFLIFFVGWLFAKLVQRVVSQVLKAVRIDAIAERVGVAAFISKGGIRHSLSELTSVLIYWLLMLIVLVTTLNVFNLTITTELLNRVILYLPRVIVTIFILVAGLYFATLVGGGVAAAAANAGLGKARFLGQLVQTIVVVFTVVISLEQLNIAQRILELTWQIVLGSVGLGVAIAIGLGCKDRIGSLVNDLIDSFRR